MILLHAPPMPFVPEEWHGRKSCAMVVCYSGDLDRTDEALAPIRALGDPVVEVLQEWPYTQQQSFLDEGEPKGAALRHEDGVCGRVERRPAGRCA